MLNNDQIAKLATLSKQGDKQAFQELYDATCNGIYFTLLKRLSNEQDAQDVLQETYVTAYKTIGKLKNEMACVAWLNRIAYNFSMRYLNEKAKLIQDTSLDDEDEAEFLDSDDDFIPETALDKKESRQIISQVINELPPQQKTAVLLYYFEELSAKEIAEITDTNESNVFKRLHRARNAIKERFFSLQQKGVTLFTMPAFTILNTVLREESKNCLSQAAKVAIWGSISSEIMTGAGVGAASVQKAITLQVKSSLVKLMATAAVGTAVVSGVLVYNNSHVQPPQENVALAPENAALTEIFQEEVLQEEPSELTQPEPPTPEPSQFAVADPLSPAENETSHREEESVPMEIIVTEPSEIPTSAMPEQVEQTPTDYVMLQEMARPAGNTATPTPTPEPLMVPPEAEVSQGGGSRRESPREQSETPATRDVQMSLELVYQVNNGPSQEEVIEDISKGSGNAFDPATDMVTVSYNDFDISRIGEYAVQIKSENADGAVATVTAKLLVIDTIVPELIVSNPYLSYKRGERPTPEEIAEKAGVSVSDNSREEIIPQISGWEQIHFHKTGEYVLYVEAADSSGNAAEKQIVIIRIEPEVIGKAGNGE